MFIFGTYQVSCVTHACKIALGLCQIWVIMSIFFLNVMCLLWYLRKEWLILFIFAYGSVSLQIHSFHFISSNHGLHIDNTFLVTFYIKNIFCPICINGRPIFLDALPSDTGENQDIWNPTFKDELLAVRVIHILGYQMSLSSKYLQALDP